ncbi:MAG: hypothetical protein C0412_14830 [Flavobacterium sp.]|nr:hypothetical protein [Flavobacterium sp.]
MKNADKKLINAWLYKGKEDLLFAKVAFKETDFYSQICCLCQQSVEKYIKAVILAEKGEIIKKDKIHNLNILAKKCKSLIDLSYFNEELRVLTQAYIPARYPDESHFKVFSKEEAMESIEIAEKVINFIEEELNKILK